MGIIEIIAVSLVVLFAIGIIILYRMVLTANEKHKKLLQECEERLDFAYQNHHLILIYCIHQLLQQSIEKEDFEQAKKYQTLLDSLTIKET